MTYPFNNSEPSLESSAIGSLSITPGTSPLASRIRAVTIAGEGTLAWTGWDGMDYATGTLPAGTYVMLATHILATGTTATGITGWV